MHSRTRRALASLLLLTLAACSSTWLRPGDSAVTLANFSGEAPPPAPREFRAAWVATVANIDWPSKPGLPMTQQQAEITAILNQAHALQLNAIILQVRPSADAIYPSALEPWTEYLSGQQGQAPQPRYDPLALWIAQAHERGIELHAWINPYRARHFSAKSPVHNSHISVTNPEAVKSYGDMLWMDPAEPAARQRTLAVVDDLLRRYDIDGVHIDDYFYPYPIAQPGVGPEPSNTAEQRMLDFPDGPAWQRYLDAGGQLARADWRREQVNQLIQSLHQRIHTAKPWVKFGVSPFGVGRPDRRAPGINGFSQYDSLYADVELWLQKGWMDYLAPQLYWPIDQTAQAFAPLLQTWVQGNTQQRHIWPGLFTSRIDSSAKSWQPQEVLNQIALTRQNPGASGHIHFSMAALLQDRKGISQQLSAQPYAQAALIPASPWLQGGAPEQPKLVPSPQDGAYALRLQAAGGAPAAWFAVWRRYGTRWHFATQPAAQSLLDLNTPVDGERANALVVSAVDRVGHESPRLELKVTLANNAIP